MLWCVVGAFALICGLLLLLPRSAIAESGADASLRDIARRAEVGLGTLYRHFPTRAALLEAILRSEFSALTASAERRREQVRDGRTPAGEALEAWFQETVAFSTEYKGVTDQMVAAIEDPESALHASCVALRTAGGDLLGAAQQAGEARPELIGDDLFSLISALAWLLDQRPGEEARGRLQHVFLGAVLVPSSS